MTDNTSYNKECLYSLSPVQAQVLFSAVCTTLGISLILNIILTCICISGRRKHRLRNRERRTSHEVEENPIYGNLSQTETSGIVYTENYPIHMSLGSLSSNNPPGVRSDSQDCYANLHLKAKKAAQKQSKCSPPQNQDPSVVPLDEPESVREGNGHGVGTNADFAVSDLYASVHNQRNKQALKPADVGEEFDDHV